MCQGTCCSSQDRQSPPWFTQWQQPPSVALQHVSLLPLPSYSWSSPGDLLCFLSLGATKLDSGMPWGTSRSVPRAVWNAAAFRTRQLHRSSGWETGANSWMVVLKNRYKETARRGSSSARSHRCIAEKDRLIVWTLCHCFTPGKSMHPTSPHACLTARWEGGDVLPLSGVSVASSTSWEAV